jgi:hypothetical protein
MTAIEILKDALQYYEIPVLEMKDNLIKVIKEYSIEVENNGLYKLYADGDVVAPFDDLDELCRFILR